MVQVVVALVAGTVTLLSAGALTANDRRRRRLESYSRILANLEPGSDEHAAVRSIVTDLVERSVVSEGSWTADRQPEVPVAWLVVRNGAAAIGAYGGLTTLALAAFDDAVFPGDWAVSMAITTVAALVLLFSDWMVRRSA